MAKTLTIHYPVSSEEEHMMSTLQQHYQTTLCITKVSRADVIRLLMRDAVQRIGQPR